MPLGDVRGLLQYVPQFRGKVFVTIVDVPESRLAETMLDLLALQDIGVQLMIASTVHTVDDLLDRATEVEIKHNEQVVMVGASAGEVLTVLQRGQAVVLDVLPETGILSAEMAKFLQSLSAKKLILLKQGEVQYPHGAFRAADLSGDDAAELHAAAAVCMAGVPRVHILDGSQAGVLLSELFSNEGVGTMVYADSYRTIRALREEDIPELLGMIGRSVRNAHLVPRNYADVVSRLDDYSVMEIDGNVVGSVALYPFVEEGMAEIACLYVKQDHEGLGYGVELVEYAEKKADEADVDEVFAFTNRAADFFQRLGYQEASADDIPVERRDSLQASGRNSRMLSKRLV